MALHQFQQDVEPLLRCQVRIELIVGPVRIVKTAKDLSDAIHGTNCTSRAATFAWIAHLLKA